MTDRKYIDDRRRGRDDDVPIIGDFSGASDFGTRPVSPPPAAEQPAPSQPRAAPRPASKQSESWRLDPRDVAQYARRARGRESRAPFATAFRYAAFALAAAVVGGVVYWNYEPLRDRAVELLALARSPATTPGETGARAPSRNDSETIVVEPPVVVGTPERSAESAEAAAESPARDPVTPGVASSVQTSPAPIAAESAPAVAEPAREAPTEAPAAAVPDSAVAAPAVAAPAEPPSPETFEFAAQVVSVSERQAGAAAVVRRRGGDLAESSVVWSASDGSATAGSDYANLGAIVERFAAGEKSHTIHVPIVGDSTAEGPESFFVTLGAGDRAGEGVEPAQRVEIVIEDDD